MKLHIIVGMLLLSLSTVSAVLADDEKGRGEKEGRLKSRVETLEQQVEANGIAISGNASAIDVVTENVTNNATNITNNQLGIIATTNSISVNADDIAANAAAIANIPTEASFDYRDFSTSGTVGSKIFVILTAGPRDPCTRETHRPSRRNVAGVSVLTIMQTRRGVDADCGFNTLVFEERDTELVLISNDVSGGPSENAGLSRQTTLRQGLVTLTSTMQVGRGFGNASFASVLDGRNLFDSATVQNSTLQGLEDFDGTRVNVQDSDGTRSNLGLIKNCLRVHTSQTGTIGLTGNADVVSVYCPGIGLVQRADGLGNFITLTQVFTVPAR